MLDEKQYSYFESGVRIWILYNVKYISRLSIQIVMQHLAWRSKLLEKFGMKSIPILPSVLIADEIYSISIPF